jgi:murein L,D-transpeptidase YcbB/YkuD
VQSPRQLASLLTGISEDDITKAINLGTTNRHNLPEQIPVFIVYQTAFIDDGGTLEFRRDVYQRDAAVAQRLTHSAQVPVATRGLPNQRGS